MSGGMGPGALKGLKVAVVVMGIVIVVGTGALIVAIVSKVTAPRHSPALAIAAPSVPEPAVPANVLLDEPAGTHITGIAAWHGGLAVSLTGGGPDRVVLLDAALRVVARVALAR